MFAKLEKLQALFKYSGNQLKHFNLLFGEKINPVHAAPGGPTIYLALENNEICSNKFNSSV